MAKGSFVHRIDSTVLTSDGLFIDWFFSSDKQYISQNKTSRNNHIEQFKTTSLYQSTNSNDFFQKAIYHWCKGWYNDGGAVARKKLQHRIWMWELEHRIKWWRTACSLTQWFCVGMQYPELPWLRWCFFHFVSLQVNNNCGFFFFILSTFKLSILFVYIVFASQVLQLWCISHLLFQLSAQVQCHHHQQHSVANHQQAVGHPRHKILLCSQLLNAYRWSRKKPNKEFSITNRSGYPEDEAYMYSTCTSDKRWQNGSCV